MTMNSQQRYRRYLEKQARTAPAPPPRSYFLLDTGQALKLTDEWRRLVFVDKIDKEAAAKMLGLAYHWEMVGRYEQKIIRLHKRASRDSRKND